MKNKIFLIPGGTDSFRYIVIETMGQGSTVLPSK